MLDRVVSFIRKHNMLNQGDKILVACSGGPDSLALLHMLHKLRAELGISLEAAHVNHMLRGQAADADEQFVVATCRSWGIPCSTKAFDVQKLSREHGRGFEEEARIIRYRFFKNLLLERGLNKIVVGHHIDDQAETVLHNIIRGTGSKGLRGMLPVNGNIVRPFLCVTKQDIEEYCREHKLIPRRDETNCSTNYMRNKIRLTLLPLLREYNGNIAGSLARLAEIMREEYDFLEQQAEKERREVVRPSAAGIVLACNGLLEKHKALQREIVRKVYEQFVPEAGSLSYIHIERVLDFCAQGSSGGRLELPGRVIVDKGYDCITFRNDEENSFSMPVIPPPGVVLKIPGITAIEELGIAVSAEIMPNEVQNHCDMVLDFAKINLPLYVRNRQKGDIFSPTGLHGRKKLKEFFIDAKIPRSQRDAIPIICDEKGILAVGVLRQDERAKTSNYTKTKLCLSFKFLGGNINGK